MTAVVILNVIGATLIVTAIVSLLAWAIVHDRQARLVLRPVRPQRTARARNRRPARAALDLR